MARRCSTTARRPFDELYERVLGRLPAVFRTPNDVLAFASSGSGAMESAVANLVRPGRQGAGLRRGQVRRALDRARARPTAPTSCATSRAGARAWTRPRSTGCCGEPDVKVVFATLSETSTGIVHDIQAIAEVARAPRRDPRRRRRLGPRRRRAAPGRVGRRRRRRRLAEGADVPARAGLRVASPSARSSTPRRAAGGRYYFDWGRTAQEPAQGRRARSRPPVSLFLGLDVALGMIEAEGLENVLRPPRRCSPARRAPASPRSGSSSSATPTSARPW